MYDEVILDDLRDYTQLLPVDLPDEFTVKDMAETAHIDKYLAQETLKLMYDMGLLTRVKDGRVFVYRAFEVYR